MSDAITTGDSGELVLAGEFPAATRQQWQNLVAKVLSSVSDCPESELSTVTADGFEIAPLYTADTGSHADPGYPGQAPFMRGRTAAGHRGGWDVRQRHEHPDPAVAREQIMEDLEGGVSSLWLGLGEGQIPVEALPEVLAEVYLDLAPVVLDAGERFTEAADVFLRHVAHQGVPAAELAGCLGADPLGVLARTGTETGQEASLEGAAALAGRCAAGFPGVRAIVVDALPFHEAGGTDAQELGCALAAGVAYLRAMRTAGLSADAAFGQLEFRYAATADQFATIAKLRAARRTWARVAAQCGVSTGQWQHAVSSWPMLTRRDPWNNILRATLACFAAGAGGADAVTIAPFDAAIGQPDRLARRVARNLQALLVEESQIARVIDPAGGSWYVEDLTEQLALASWTCFQDIERSGGLRAALAGGVIAGQLATSRDARRDALARRREAITGVSEFPLVGETLLTRPAAPRPAAPRTATPRTATPRPATRSRPASARPGKAGGLPRIRWAQWHEEFRDRADAHARLTGSPPAVILALLDSSRPTLAQAERVRALLAPIGITTADASQVTVVCGSPDATADEMRAAVDKARTQGVATVVVAADVIAEGMDVLTFGDRMFAALGVV